jgi:CRISPR/Cas system CSM-associated protein Csm3 (group 7 of RAMP superfamily)
MKTINYSIQFFTYWHCSSGLIGGPDASATVIKNEQRLPYIPGKTLKGLLRENAETYLQTIYGKTMADQFVRDVFGPKDAFIYEKQSSFFGNAQLSPALVQSITPENAEFLYERLASTEIDDHGQAKDKSLRQIEVAIPLTLHAQILDFPEEENYREAINYCLQGVKRMGSYRTRGLGRCQFTLQNENET